MMQFRATQIRIPKLDINYDLGESHKKTCSHRFSLSDPTNSYSSSLCKDNYSSKDHEEHGNAKSHTKLEDAKIRVTEYAGRGQRRSPSRRSPRRLHSRFLCALISVVARLTRAGEPTDSSQALVKGIQKRLDAIEKKTGYKAWDTRSEPRLAPEAKAKATLVFLEDSSTYVSVRGDFYGDIASVIFAEQQQASPVDLLARNLTSESKRELTANLDEKERKLGGSALKLKSLESPSSDFNPPPMLMIGSPAQVRSGGKASLYRD